jgi:hypothetical protein
MMYRITWMSLKNKDDVGHGPWFGEEIKTILEAVANQANANNPELENWVESDGGEE